MTDPLIDAGFSLANPGFAHAGRVHDWRNYIGENTQAIWHTLTDEQRLAIARDADARAGQEDWD